MVAAERYGHSLADNWQLTLRTFSRDESHLSGTLGASSRLSSQSHLYAEQALRVLLSSISPVQELNAAGLIAFLLNSEKCPSYSLWPVASRDCAACLDIILDHCFR